MSNACVWQAKSNQDCPSPRIPTICNASCIFDGYQLEASYNLRADVDLTTSVFTAPLRQVQTKLEANALLVPWWPQARIGPRNLSVLWMQPFSAPDHGPWGLTLGRYVWRCGVSLQVESLRPRQPGSQHTAPDELTLEAKANFLRCRLSRGTGTKLLETGWKRTRHAPQASVLSAIIRHKRRTGNMCGKLALPVLKHLKGKLFCGLSPVAAVRVKQELDH